jgi:uncharacterized membrane protein
VHDGTLVYTTTDDVYYYSNQGDDAKNAAGAELLFGNLDASAGCRGAGLEDVGAAVGGSDEGDCVERSQGISVAEERDDGVLATGEVGRGFFAASLFALLVIVVLVLVLMVIVVVANDSTGEERGCRSVRAWRSIGIVQDEFAATEDGFGALLAVAHLLALWHEGIATRASYPILYVFPSSW